MAKIFIVGIGPGGKDYLLPAAERVIRCSDTLIGYKRQLEPFLDLGKHTVELKGNYNDVLHYITDRIEEEQISVLVSGDPGLYSFMGRLSGHLTKDQYEIIPGLSSFQLAMARIKENWHDALIISLHGKVLDTVPTVTVNNKRMVVFTDHRNTPAAIADFLLRRGIRDRKVYIACRLGYRDEKIVKTPLSGVGEVNLSQVQEQLCIMIIMEEGYED